jgi:uncharacterized protein (DUF433 family)
MNKPHIISDPKIMHGKPVIEGTRLTVELILEKLSEGRSEEEVLSAYPRLTREGLQAALAYATAVIKNEDIYPVTYKLA